MLLALLLLAFADSPAPRLMAAPKLGLFEPTSRLSGALMLGAEFGYLTPALDDRLAVVLEVDWVRPRTDGTITDPRAPAGQTYSLANGEVGILLSAVYRAENFIPRLTPYAGGGPGLYFHRAAVSAFGNQYLETETHVGLQLLGGAEYAIGPGGGFAEVRYQFARVDFVSTGNANVGGFLALGLGYRFKF